MNRGVVIFATDSDSIKYTAMAQWSADRIQRHLGLPVTVINGQDLSPQQRWFDDFGSNVDWYNSDRSDAWNLSPYDETLVLDADYVVSSDCLIKLFETKQDFLAMGEAYDVTGLRENINQFGRYNMPMAWATVMFFRRSRLARAVFEMMQMIREHWHHYRDLYGFPGSLFRNDYALSIALNTLHGHQGRWPAIPWKMASLDPEHKLTQLDQDRFEVIYSKPDGRRSRIMIDGQDFHAMCKRDLGAIVDAAM
jgi:hypothetical protein